MGLAMCGGAGRHEQAHLKSGQSFLRVGLRDSNDFFVGQSRGCGMVGNYGHVYVHIHVITCTLHCTMYMYMYTKLIFIVHVHVYTLHCVSIMYRQRIEQEQLNRVMEACDMVMCMYTYYLYMYTCTCIHN